MKIHQSFLIAALTLTVALLTACGGGGTASSAVGPQPVTAASIEQYTPDQANWATISAKTLAVVKAQDPDSITWLTKPWPKWDGTVYDPTKMTPAAFYAALFPNGDGDQLVGLREVFYQYKPFADNRNPTKAEVDEWHRIAINHLRSLVGYTSANLQVKPDHALFVRALWGDERKYTLLWDKYPGVADSAYGPCVAGTNPHCGATFFPSDPADQAPYLPLGFAPITFLPSGAEGVFSAPKSNIPWSIKWVRAFSAALKTEGFWGGHTGPWFHRETFGFSFWDSDPSNNNSIAILRAKWSGTLNPGFYPQPAP